MTRETAWPALLVCACILATLSGCGGPHAGTAELVSGEETAPLEPRAYRLRAGDVVIVSFVTAPELSQKTPITPGGTVTVPMAGDVPAAGLTAAELAESIEARMAPYLRDAAVSVTIDGLAQQPVYVLGEVRSPGAVRTAAELTVTRALSEAGGLLPSGKPSSVMIVRTHGVTEPTALRVDVTDVLSGRDLMEDVALQPNDVVYVPKSIIGKVGGFVETFFSQIAPAQLFYLRGYNMLNIDRQVYIE